MANILIIEDDELTRELYSEILKNDGHTILEANDGSEGLKLVETNKIDLIITDLLMPNVDGMEVIITIRKTQPDLPIIAISGGGMGTPELYLFAASNFGASMTLKKPLSHTDLSSAVQDCLEKDTNLSK